MLRLIEKLFKSKKSKKEKRNFKNKEKLFCLDLRIKALLNDLDLTANADYEAINNQRNKLELLNADDLESLTINKINENDLMCYKKEVKKLE